MELQLAPSGRLVAILEATDEADKTTQSLYDAFAQNWCEGLFRLAAKKQNFLSFPTVQYWRSFAEEYLNALCHQPDNQSEWQVEQPSLTKLEHFVLRAPPMHGGEYLNQNSLLNIWQAIDSWTCDTAQSYDTTGDFLRHWAPNWRQVGRVCFHLAENRKNPHKPFAFLATYSTGVGASGQVKHVPIGRALQEYAGAQNKSRLQNLLSPVSQASEMVPWVKELVDSNKLYQPMAWSPEQAFQLLQTIPELEKCGLTIRVPDWWKKRAKASVSIVIGEKKRSYLSADAMLDFQVTVALGDTELNQEEIEELLKQQDGLYFFKGQWIEVAADKLQEALQHWERIQAETKDGELTFAEGMRLLAGTSASLTMENTQEEPDWVHIKAGTAIRKLLEKLRSPEQIAQRATIEGLQATLRPYQQTGVNWLALTTELGLGACLADDMGLGKTIQLLSLLMYFKNKHKQTKTSLLVVPASLLGNWKQEAHRFTPDLRLSFLHASEMTRMEMEKIANAPKRHLKQIDLVVTTYSMVLRQKWLGSYPWYLAVLDEAQAIKNPGSQQTKACKQLQTHARIALTGTPIENRLGDLWSLFDFINPGLLGSGKTFSQFIKHLQSTNNSYAPLRRLVSPYILRRMKTDPAIIPDLPEKTELTRYAHLTKAQIKLYQNVISTMKDTLESESPPEGIERKGLVLRSLMRLKQICNHPSQATGNGEYTIEQSGKLELLATICKEIASRQEKVLVFTQFREIIDMLEAHLTTIFGQPGLLLHGGTPVKQRKDLVAAFQKEGGPPFFVLSLKAGGTGLNLTAANHVIHFDRWWNPAVENQATDRAYRIGQKRNIIVHKFVTSGTIEERIDALIQEKQELASDLLEEKQEINVTELSDDALLELIRLDIHRASA